MPDLVRRPSPSPSSVLAQPSSASADLDAAAARPRNRRLVSTAAAADTTAGASGASSSLFSSGTLGTSTSRGASPIPSARLGSTGRPADRLYASSSRSVSTTPTRTKGKAAGSWAPGWAAVQDFASSLLAGGDGAYDREARLADGGSGSRSAARPVRRGIGAGSRLVPDRWGPEPPGKSRPRLDDVAAGTLTQREAALRARKMASVLESHEGVNGGLDIAGKFKRRTSDEDFGRAAQARGQETDEYLAYIHHVQPTDTYAGIVLRYRCREDVFRKANGLWSRDNVQVQKWLVLPVDACEVKGRPCEAPSYYNQDIDLLAPIPGAGEGSERQRGGASEGLFTIGNGKLTEQPKAAAEGEWPWTHVRWVTIDGFKTPVEIGRVARKTMGYFRPRRKKSLHTVSTLSTPRASLDAPGRTLSSTDAVGSPGSSTSRRHSLLTSRPAWAYGASPSPVTRSRGASGGADDLRPTWMQRPGGVGTMSREIRAPGPDNDYFNTWAKKHLPGLTIESLPSMSIMGSETARFGFDVREAAAGIVESSFEDGRDATSASQQGSGLDKAAVAIEAWLRGAFAKRPATPLGGSARGRQPEDGDLIELADTNSDDGRAAALVGPGNDLMDSGLLNLTKYGSSSRSDGEGAVRGRILGGGVGAKDKKVN